MKTKSISLIFLLFTCLHGFSQDNPCKIYIEYIHVFMNYNRGLPKPYADIDYIRNDEFKKDTCFYSKSMRSNLIKILKRIERTQKTNSKSDNEMRDGRIVITISGEKWKKKVLFIGGHGELLYNGKLYAPDKELVSFLKLCFSDITMTLFMSKAVGLPHPWIRDE